MIARELRRERREREPLPVLPSRSDASILPELSMNARLLRRSGVFVAPSSPVGVRVSPDMRRPFGARDDADGRTWRGPGHPGRSAASNHVCMCE